MKVGIWGAGNLGPGLAYRLTTSPFVSELYWVNRSYEEISRRVIDLEHGLAFVPTCHSVIGVRQEDVATVLSGIDVLVLTLGMRVPPGGAREDIYKGNAAIYREVVIPALKGRFNGIVLVITNPVDLMARLVFREASLAGHRVMGLGTIVETARLKASLGAYLSPVRPARDVWAHAVGTHDPNFVPIANPGLAVGDYTAKEELNELLKLAKREVVKAADRVKTENASSLHPIVEGTVRVLEAFAYDQRAMLTVSVRDPDTPDELFYSMPCCLGSRGVLTRNSNQSAEIRDGIGICCESLRKVLKAAGEL
jgi:L-lactate dehydrogenase